MHQNSIFRSKIKKILGRGIRPQLVGQIRHLFWTTLSTAVAQLVCCPDDRTPLLQTDRPDWHLSPSPVTDQAVPRQSCINCIGCLSINESSTRLYVWYTSLWLVRHPHTSPTTANSLRTVIAVSYAQPPPGHASFHGRTTTSAIEVSMLQACACGTVYCRNYDET